MERRRFKWYGDRKYYTQKAIDNYIYIKIGYYKQENLGKSMAHNKGVELTRTELFTCVDSDDYLVPNAVERVMNTWNAINVDRKYIGIVAFRGKKEGTSITKVKNKNIDTLTMRQGFRKYGVKGDTMLIFKKSVIGKYKFPEFEGEKFVPESYLYDLLD